jgi:hypothetical protein
MFPDDTTTFTQSFFFHTCGSSSPVLKLRTGPRGDYTEVFLKVAHRFVGFMFADEKVVG